jgi:hypothetical protein
VLNFEVTSNKFYADQWLGGGGTMPREKSQYLMSDSVEIPDIFSCIQPHSVSACHNYSFKYYLWHYSLPTEEHHAGFSF